MSKKKLFFFFFFVVVVRTKLSPMYSREEMSGENSKCEGSASAKRGRFVKEKFTQVEDDLLKHLVGKYGTNKWNLIGSLMRGRNSRQCRDRWNHYLCDENLKHDDFTKEDDELLMKLYSEVGHRWTIIAKHFERRNSVIVRNRIFKLLRKFNKQSKEKIKTKEMKKKANSIVYLMPATESLCNPQTRSDVEKRTIFPSCSSLPFVLDESQFTLFNQWCHDLSDSWVFWRKKKRIICRLDYLENIKIFGYPLIVVDFIWYMFILACLFLQIVGG